MSDEQFFENCRERSKKRLTAFAEILRELLGSDESMVLGSHACVYVTGSGGRLELGQASDLDLFLARVDEEPSRIDEILLQAATIKAIDRSSFPRPSRDGLFLELHTAGELEEHLGTPEDDGLNKLTPRMLLLLESRVVCGNAAYDSLVDRMIGAYWKNEDDHKRDYLPFVLVNDIVRYWRIVLLNHESRLKAKEQKLAKEGSSGDTLKNRMDVERRMRGYKLRFARCLICFASLAYLLALAKRSVPAIKRADVKRMVGFTPLERLTRVAEIISEDPVLTTVGRLRSQYRAYLEQMDRSKEEIEAAFAKEDYAEERKKEAEVFVRDIFDLIMALRSDSRLFRCVVV